MTTRRLAPALAVVFAVLLTGCGEDVKDAVDQAKGAASDVGDAAKKAKDEATAIAAIVKEDNRLANHPVEVLNAAKKTCVFIENNSSKAKQIDEVRERFDRVGATSLEAENARLILSVLKSDVCPLLK